MTDAAVYTITGLTETDVLCRYSGGKAMVSRFWHDAAFDFAAGEATHDSEEARLRFGFTAGDAEQIQLAVKQASGNFPGGDLETRVGRSWLVEREDHRGWRVVGERVPGAVGRELHAESAVSNGELGAGR